MKLFSLILSIIVFFTALFFFVDKLPYIATFNDMIYISLLGILMTICITGIIINWEIFSRPKKGKVILFITNSFSRRNKK